MLKKCVDLENEIRSLIRIIGVKLSGTLKYGIYGVTVEINHGYPLINHGHPSIEFPSIELLLSLARKSM